MNFDLNNPWHKVTIGGEAPEIVNGIIEIPQNSRAKYELNKASGLLKLDRVKTFRMPKPAMRLFVKTSKIIRF